MADTQTNTPAYETLGELRAAALQHHQNGDLGTARKLYRRYLAHQPEDAIFWSNLGALFRTEKNFEMAAACQRRAVSLDATSESILNNASNALYDAGEIEDALEMRRRALRLAPSKVENYVTLAKCLRALGQHLEAETEIKKALKAHPDNAELHIQLSFCQLSRGNYPEGFKNFHWRWQGDEISPPEFTFPQWQGEDLKGKTILVTPEQGFGDTVLMARFFEPLKALGCVVKFACKPPLRRVFAGLPGVDAVPETNSEIADCSYWAPMMDLPRWLGTVLDTVRPPAPLSLPQDSVDRAREIVAPFTEKFKLGVLWSGSVTYRANHKRSFNHKTLLQLADIANLQMFSLYKGPLLDDFHADGTSCIILDAAGNDRDFADSAAMMRELDLVVTMDSAIAHIGGSMGLPVWNLLHSEAYWLYEPFDDHTPWYPSMRLIRQEKPGDWQGVFDLLREEISELVRIKSEADG
ncbi:MAG: tetratricopeptide repeat protein [Rhodobacteraceae bacterium]|nr:tetratricopeptide repeat protein [Paracoccaceae bacterium]